TRGSVSINLRALKKHGWVKTGEHHLVALTPKGLKAVQATAAKRVVVKAFLADVLGTPEPQAEIDSCKIEHLLSHTTGERLFQFMRFLMSNDAAAAELLARFRRFAPECPEDRTCGICHGHCLADELDRAV